MILIDDILILAKKFYPTGRAFKMPFGGWLERLNYALGISEAKAYNDALEILNSLLPDNADFTTDDATDWERRLGMISSNATLEDRKLAIKRKMNHPGDIKARQHYLYVQGQLQAAGFDVFVYENRFDDGMGGLETRSPFVVLGGLGLLDVQHGDFQHGDIQHGGIWGNVIANYIDEAEDRKFNVGNNLRSTFFICGNPIGTVAYVPAVRKEEFRQLILKLKPAQTVGYLSVIYI
jgi:hypothetical protein